MPKVYIKHGEPCPRHKNRLHKIWQGMRKRCNISLESALNCSSISAKNSYKNYASRGIVVCDEWQDWKAFEAWATANGYGPLLSIERINNDGPYCPDNCMWATVQEQNRNRRSNRPITAFGETMLITDWAKSPKCVVSAANLAKRIRRGVPPELAITKSNKRHPVTAFGETKSIKDWAKDSRCVVQYGTLVNRISIKEMPPEQALTLPVGPTSVRYH